MNLPPPRPVYDVNNEAQARRLIAEADDENQKKRGDVVIRSNRLILTSPDGTRWSATISDVGVLTWTAL